MGKDLGFPFWISARLALKAINMVLRTKPILYDLNLKLFVIIEGQGGERTQLVPKGLQNTEISRCMQKI